MKTTNLRHVATYNQEFMDRALERAGLPFFTNPQTSIEILAGKFLARLHVPRNFYRSSNGPVFSSMMGPGEAQLLPFGLWTEVIPYCFDAWPPIYDRWASFFERYRIRTAFFSARQSAEHFARTLPHMRSIWLPEATDPTAYDASVTWSERDIDVLELGRKFDLYNNEIAPSLAAAGRIHLFEKVKGEIVFTSQAALVSGLARSKISICFPSSVTHPERSGTVETITHRYFESMASKCLLVGHAPQELIDLFGYNPVIEVQSGEEAAQIERLLNGSEPHHDLIERNYRRLLEVGNYDARIATMLQLLSA